MKGRGILVRLTQLCLAEGRSVGWNAKVERFLLNNLAGLLLIWD